MKHFANFRDCRIKHNEINGGQKVLQGLFPYQLLRPIQC